MVVTCQSKVNLLKSIHLASIQLASGTYMSKYSHFVEAI